MAAEAGHILEEWRRAERLLRILPADAPERRDVEVHLEEMRRLYQRLTGDTRPPAGKRPDPASAEIERTHALLDAVFAKYAQRAEPAADSGRP